MELPALIEALDKPEAYSYPVEKVEVRQTHISAVFLAGPYVYKVKKPVNLGFLDFSTLDKRREICHREIQLNRRLAPEVYLDVVPLVPSDGGVRVEGPGTACEWAVKMVRLPDEATVQQRLQSNGVGPELVKALAGKIASFHRSAQTNDIIASFGRFERVSQTLRDVFTQAGPAAGTTVSHAVFDRVRFLMEESLARFRPLIDDRARQRITRDTHGDMHLDHIYYFPDRKPPADLVIIDCIEFNDHFRYIDPVADMAFPRMDFIFFGHRDLARIFTDAYFRVWGDEPGRALLPLYTSYRATVRGAVEGILLGEGEVPELDRAAAWSRARAHWLLALTELEVPRQKPCLVLVTGLPGSGKSTLARALADKADLALIRSDVIRKELAGLPRHQPSPTEIRPELYTSAWNDRTYGECLSRAGRLLFEGKRVLVDASFGEEKRRRVFLEAAVKWGVPALMFLCRADADTIRRRLSTRQGDASDADWTIHQLAAGKWQEPGPDTRKAIQVISTEENSEEVMERALQVLGDWDLYQ